MGGWEAARTWRVPLLLCNRLNLVARPALRQTPETSIQVPREVPTLEPQIPSHQSYPTQACAPSGFLSRAQGRPRCSELCRPRYVGGARSI